jgi:hypothetical protein
VLVAAAALDALRRGDEPAPDAAPPYLRGELVWSDRDCRRHAVRLPDLARRDFRTIGCGVFTRHDNLGVRDGELSWFAFRGGETLVLGRDAIARELGPEFRAAEGAWLRRLRYAAVLAGPRDVAALFEGETLLAQLRTGPPGSLRVRASARGSYFAIIDGETTIAFDRRGRRLDLPREARAIAWSPDERWTVLAAGDELRIAPARGGDVVARIDAAAVDVDWR